MSRAKQREILLWSVDRDRDWAPAVRTRIRDILICIGVRSEFPSMTAFPNP